MGIKPEIYAYVETEDFIMSSWSYPRLLIWLEALPVIFSSVYHFLNGK